MVLVERDSTVSLCTGCGASYPMPGMVLDGLLGTCGFRRWDLRDGLYYVVGGEGLRHLLIRTRRGLERVNWVSCRVSDAICEHLDRGETFFRAVYLTRGLC